MEETVGAVKITLLIYLLLTALLPAQLLELDAARILSQPNRSAPVVVQPIAQGYLYLEPHQARVEALLDASTVMRLVDAQATLPSTLSAETQKKLIEGITSQTEGWCRLLTGGSVVPGTALTPAIVRGKPGATLPLEDGATVPLAEAMVGFTWEFPTPPLPDEITLEWHGPMSTAKALPVRIFFGKTSEAVEIFADFPRLTWKNQGRLPRPAPLAQIPGIPPGKSLRLPLASIAWFLGCLAFYLTLKLRGHRLPGGAAPFIGAWLLGAVLTWPMLRISLPIPGTGGVQVTETTSAEAILTPLLRNAYRAFDQRSESAIYDVLARSVDGELLRKLYLETIQALTLEGREGTRVTITEFDATVASVESTDTGFTAECQWTALGTVGHWGHAHTRVNRYTAEVTVSPVAGEWKMTALQVREARRL